MNQQESLLSRRGFLTGAAGALASLTLPANALAQRIVTDLPSAGYSLPLGVCTSYDKAGLVKSAGYSFVEESVGGFLIPEAGDGQYAKNKLAIQVAKVPVRSYIYFFPGNLKSVGPDLHHDAILDRADLALRRAKECGSKNIVFGSGGSRAIPDGFDRARAKAQHIELCQKMAPLAEKHGVTLAVEPLNRGETNFINSLADGVEIIQAVNNPWFKLQCDIYHMLKENESPDEIVKYADYITHCHIAEKRNRTAPGVEGDDFRPYLRALKQINYTGGLSLECRWKDFDSEITRGIAVIQQQLASI